MAICIPSRLSLTGLGIKSQSKPPLMEVIVFIDFPVVVYVAEIQIGIALVMVFLILSFNLKQKGNIFSVNEKRCYSGVRKNCELQSKHRSAPN